MTLTFDQANNVLTIAASFDKRTIGELDITMWQQALRGLAFPACAAAVVKHYSTTTDYLLPVHISRLVADEQRELDAAQHIAGADAERRPEQPAARRQRPGETRPQWMARLQTQDAAWYRKHGLHRDATDAEVRAAEGNPGRSKPWTPHTAAEGNRP
ncbi:MAG TPA: hypothetical protein VGG83_10580 [Trebonia sp.]|jgi:hypothetical protein